MIEYINTNILALLAILIIMIFFKRRKMFLQEKLKGLKYFMITSLQFVLKTSIDYLSKIELLLSKKDVVSNDLLLEDLTANLIDEENFDQLKTYLNALRFAVSNKNVINIALTGGFGTGKSTIINEFCKKNRGYEYLHISLANFNDEKADEKLIETSIVQQILYYEKKLKIKESSYKRIHFTKPLHKFGIIFLLVIWIYTLVFLFFENINNKITLFDSYRTSIQSIRFVFVLGVIYFLFKSFDKIKNIKFSKLTPNSLEIVNEKTDMNLSVFNRNIDEIIYFFEKTNTNIVIVEDIDRFSDDIAIKLYSKIRELSILIKQSKDVIQPVKFIYSVKDELILEDKTKFFDIIIPVIPITDYSNSKNMFLLKLENFFEKEDKEKEEAQYALELVRKSYLDKNFIAEISNYVYDMRTVINICNEFKLYNEILIIDKPNIDKNKLFAIIFYKNIYPEDFARIQKNESKLHRIFKKDFKNDNGLQKIITGFEKELIEVIDEKDTLEKTLNGQLVKDINELRNIYIFNLITLINEKHNVKIKDIEGLKLGYDLVTDENFKKIKESINIKFSYDYASESSSSISFKDVENRVNVKLSYEAREKLIKNFHENKIDLLERRILYLNNEKQIICNLSLCELYENYNEGIDKFLDLVYSKKTYRIVDGKEFIETNLHADISLFKYLLKNDYLNEDFIEYVSYFYSGSLSSNDHKLMMKINQNEFTSFDEKIDNVDNLVKSTRDIRFKNQSILIYDIFEFLLKDSQNYSLRNEKLDFVLGQIQNYNDRSVYFIEGFLNKISNDNNLLSNFYVEITKWDKFWNLVETKFSEDLRRVILFDLIQLFSDDIGDRTLIKLNKNKGITKYINSDENFLKDILDRISINSFIKTLILLEVQFERINPDGKINDLLFQIYKNNLYQINIDNLKLFVQIDTKYDYNEESFLQSNFSFLKSNIDSILYKKVSSNLNKYVENVYLKIEQNVNEKSKEVLYLLELKDEILGLENRLQIIKKGFNGRLEKFGEIQSKEIKELLFEKNKISATWINVIDYYNWFGPSTSILTNYLNIEENFTKLMIAELLEEFDDSFKDKESGQDFIYSFINDDDLSEESFKSLFEIVGALKLESSKIELESRVPFLIDKGTLKFNEEQFKFLLEKNQEILIKLIEKNENEFIADLGGYIFEVDFIEILLNSKLLAQNLNNVIDFYEDEIIKIEELKILNRIARFYNENKLVEFSSEMFKKLVFSDLLEEYKIGLFNMYFSIVENKNKISDVLELMGGKFKGVLEEEDVIFDISAENLNFLTIIKDNKLIKNFRRDNKKRIFVLSY